MIKLKKLFFISLLLFSFCGYSQEKIKHSVSINVNITPLPFMMDNHSYLLFLKPRIKHIDNKDFVIYRKALTKQTYYFGYNVLFKNNFNLGFKIGYCKVQNLGYSIRTNDTSGFIIVNQLKSNYFGGEIDFLKQIKVNKLGTNFIHGVRIGGGKLFRKPNDIKGGVVADLNPKISSKYEKKSFTQEVYEVKDIKMYSIGDINDLYHFNIKYTFLVEQKITDKLSFLAGIDIPLIRLFFYNSVTFQTGLELNTDDFFTGLKSYSLQVGDSESFNKNFAYSLKKNHATSLKLGVKYFF